jgi:hypothetical protein
VIFDPLDREFNVDDNGVKKDIGTKTTKLKEMI